VDCVRESHQGGDFPETGENRAHFFLKDVSRCRETTCVFIAGAAQGLARAVLLSSLVPRASQQTGHRDRALRRAGRLETHVW
jgi:hypothetical protein